MNFKEAREKSVAALHTAEARRAESAEREAAMTAVPPPDPMMCEFCQKEDGDPACFLEVCPECWNRANAGTGWMQRALKAEARIVELEQALDGVRLQLIAAGTQLSRGQDL